MAFCLKRKETSLSSSVQQRLYVGANAMRHIDDFAETVTSVCYRAYDDLPKTGKPSRGCEWTLLSAVLLQDVNQATLQIVSFATGTKSIPTGLACRLGNQVIDNHAEVLARRCFLRFAYSELLKLACGEDSSVFETTGSSVFECRLKPGLRIHFFSSHTPCGDASIFPKNGDVLSVAALEDTENDATASKRPRLDPEDIYRTGAKCVPGTAQDKKLPGADYHQLGVARTKPGRGATSLSMSCSDKMAKWHSCGLEGALLSHFLAGEEPLRLSSFQTMSHPLSFTTARKCFAILALKLLKTTLILLCHVLQVLCGGWDQTRQFMLESMATSKELLARTSANQWLGCQFVEENCLGCSTS
nr:tRNA-specific adenosine deaminase 1-like isoform X4 [Dermacentor andersoni]XP_054918766.1 tRNA-specific adenosine deaminase 1-like isoform X4 [Dermacentor andersoni]